MAAKAPEGYGPARPKRTALKLWLMLVIANIAALFAAVYVSSYLRAGVGNPSTLFAFYYGAIVVAGLADAFWIDEFAFKGAFRRMLQGKTGRFVGKNADLDDVAASLQISTSTFPVILLLACLATYGVFNLVNGGFNRWWSNIGEHAHTLRSDASSSPEKILAVHALSMHNQPEVLKILEARLLDEDPEVAGLAAWAIGRQRDNPTMNINRIPALVERTRNGPPTVRREALLTLARLQHQAIADEVVAALDAELSSGEAIDLRLIWGLGYLQHSDSLDVLDRALYHPDPEIQRLAAWALSQQRDSGQGRAAADLLEQRLPAAPLATKCAIVHSLGILTDERSNLALIHTYDSLSAEQRGVLCERISVFIAPDGEHDREDLLMPQDRFGMKTIQALGTMRATSPEIRAAVEPWLEGVIASSETNPLTAEAGRSLLRGIREQRNDRQRE